MQPIRFLLTSIGLCVVIFLLHRPAPSADIYGSIPIGAMVSLAPITEAELLASKLAHGRLNPKYRIGLFGNSRSIMVSAADLGLAERSFFNFSVPGASIRTSVYMVEELRKYGKVPELVIISFDHLEVEFYGNPSVRGWLRRLRLAGADFGVGWRQPEISLRSVARMMWRHLNGAINDGLRYFNFNQLVIGLNWRTSPVGPKRWWSVVEDQDIFGYRRDGSRGDRPNRPRDGLRVRRRAPSTVISYLKHDLDRLARAAAGSTVIIYESPVHPSNVARFREKPAPHARQVREALLRHCRKLRFRCVPFPDGLPGDDGSQWRDGSHAPAAQLGRYLRQLIAAADQTDSARDAR